MCQPVCTIFTTGTSVSGCSLSTPLRFIGLEIEPNIITLEETQAFTPKWKWCWINHLDFRTLNSNTQGKQYWEPGSFHHSILGGWNILLNPQLQGAETQERLCGSKQRGQCDIVGKLNAEWDFPNLHICRLLFSVSYSNGSPPPMASTYIFSADELMASL